MRVLVSTLLTLGLAAMLSGCGGSKQEDTTPASNENAPAEGEEGAEGGEAAGGEQPAEEQPKEEQGGGGW